MNKLLTAFMLGLAIAPCTAMLRVIKTHTPTLARTHVRPYTKYYPSVLSLALATPARSLPRDLASAFTALKERDCQLHLTKPHTLSDKHEEEIKAAVATLAKYSILVHGPYALPETSSEQRSSTITNHSTSNSFMPSFLLGFIVGGNNKETVHVHHDHPVTTDLKHEEEKKSPTYDDSKTTDYHSTTSSSSWFSNDSTSSDSSSWSSDSGSSSSYDSGNSD